MTMVFKNSAGAIISQSVWQIWEGGAVPAGYTSITGTVDAVWTFIYMRQAKGCTYGNDGPLVAEPAWSAAVSWDTGSELAGFLSGGYFIRKFKALSISAVFVQPSGGSPTPAREYDYSQPPFGLAQNLLSAQSWTPWRGVIEVRESAASGLNLLNRKFNLLGGLATAATADALAEEIEHDFTNEKLRIRLGAPPRQDYKSLVARVKGSSADNIKWL